MVVLGGDVVGLVVLGGVVVGLVVLGGVMFGLVVALAVVLAPSKLLEVLTSPLESSLMTIKTGASRRFFSPTRTKSCPCLESRLDSSC